MTKVARWIEIAIGLFFLVSAAAKAIDMDAFAVQISAYNVVKDADAVRASAWIALLAEMVLGGALMAGFRARGVPHLASGAMILVYSSLIAYAWGYHGLTDCGCLGAWITMSPAQSLAKNVVLLVALAFAWFGGFRGAAPVALSRKMGIAAAAAAEIAIVGLAIGGLFTRGAVPNRFADTAPADGSRPFAQFVFEADGQHFDLGKGEFLVAFLNSTCEHCRASVPALNRLIETPGLPPMIALMMGDADEFADFQAQTSPLFSGHRIESLTFMEFIGTVPPRLSYIRDGVGVQHWDWEDVVPEAEIVARFVPVKK